MKRVLVSCLAALTLFTAKPVFAQSPTPEKLAKDYVCGMSTAFLVVGLSSVSSTASTSGQSRESLMFFTAGLRGWALVLKEIPWPSQTAYSKKVFTLATTLEKQSAAYFQLLTKGVPSTKDAETILKPIGQAITSVLTDPAFDGKCNNGTAVDSILGGNQQSTPAPTPTAVTINAPSTPLIFTGHGDSVIELQYAAPGALRVTGNAEDRYFGITAYAANGKSLGAIVNVTEPYQGIVPINIRPNEIVQRLQVEAEGEWKIEVLGLNTLRTLNVPGEITGTGDEVIILTGAHPDIAKVKGNEADRYFGIIAYAGNRSLGAFVNETAPYEGSQVLDPDTTMLEIRAEGPWSINISASK